MKYTMNQYDDILIRTAHDAYYALQSLDEQEANRILDAFAALYVDAPEHVERNPADLFTASPTPISREELRFQFEMTVKNTLMRRWVASLTQQEADMLEDIMSRLPGMTKHITIADSVDILPGEIRMYIKLNREDEAYRIQYQKELEEM